MRYALITGGLGLIGTRIAWKILESGSVDKVVCLDHYGRYVDSVRREFNDYRKLRLEGIEDRVIIERGEAKYFSIGQRLIREYRPRYVIHLAALPLAKIDNLNTEEAREGSVDATAALLETIGALSKEDGYKPEKFVYASSSMVYGNFDQDEVSEDSPTAPIEIYGTMKLAGETVTSGLGRFYDIPTAIIRPSAVYGPTDMNRRVSQIFIEKAIRGETLSIQGADEALDFTYVDDTAEGFVLAALKPTEQGEVFNITYGQARTLRDFAECLKVHFPDLKYEVVERDSFRPKRGTLSIDRARRRLGFQPKFPLEEGIRHYVDFVRNRVGLD